MRGVELLFCVIILLMQKKTRVRLILTPCSHVLPPWCCDAPSARVAHHFSPVLPACCCGSSVFLLYSSSWSSRSADHWTFRTAWFSRFTDLTCRWRPTPELWCVLCFGAMAALGLACARLCVGLTARRASPLLRPLHRLSGMTVCQVTAMKPLTQAYFLIELLLFCISVIYCDLEFLNLKKKVQILKFIAVKLHLYLVFFFPVLYILYSISLYVL